MQEQFQCPGPFGFQGLRCAMPLTAVPYWAMAMRSTTRGVHAWREHRPASAWDCCGPKMLAFI